jgi:predicted dehydrogenase
VRSARLAGADVVGVAASSPDRAREAADRLGVPQAFGSAEEAVASDDVDVVHVCAPNDRHAPLAEAALRAGKHVVCEKPLATTAAEADRVLEVADASGLVATVPFVYRYNAMVVEARARVAAGAIGTVRLVHGGYLQDWLSTPEDDNWRVDPARSGASRAFADIGSHWCDLLEFVTGQRIAAVCAQTATVVPERVDRGHAPAFAVEDRGHPPGERRAIVTEDLATVLFRTDAGVLGTMLVSQVSPGRKNHLHIEISGSEASLRFEQENPEVLWIGRRERNETVWRDPAALDPAAARVSSLPPGHAEGYTGCFEAFVRDTYAAIAGDRPDGLPRFSDGARSMRVVDAVVTSARAGAAWVDV